MGIWEALQNNNKKIAEKMDRYDRLSDDKLLEKFNKSKNFNDLVATNNLLKQRGLK